MSDTFIFNGSFPGGPGATGGITGGRTTDMLNDPLYETSSTTTFTNSNGYTVTVTSYKDKYGNEEHFVQVSNGPDFVGNVYELNDWADQVIGVGGENIIYTRDHDNSRFWIGLDPGA